MMNDNESNGFERVQFKSPRAIAFYGWDGRVEHYPFRIIGEDGKPTEYIGVFIPDFCVQHRFLSVIRENELEDGSYLEKPMGLCANTRIIAALLNIAYPEGKTREFADFDALDECVVERSS